MHDEKLSCSQRSGPPCHRCLLRDNAHDDHPPVPPSTCMRCCTLLPHFCLKLLFRDKRQKENPSRFTSGVDEIWASLVAQSRTKGPSPGYGACGEAIENDRRSDNCPDSHQPNLSRVLQAVYHSYIRPIAPGLRPMPRFHPSHARLARLDEPQRGCLPRFGEKWPRFSQP